MTRTSGRTRIGKARKASRTRLADRSGEGDDEAQEIERQGDDPEQRHRREVRGQVGRHAHQPARRDEDQDEPSEPGSDIRPAVGRLTAGGSPDIPANRRTRRWPSSDAIGPGDGRRVHRPSSRSPGSGSPSSRSAPGRPGSGSARSRTGRTGAPPGCRRCSRRRGNTDREPGDVPSPANQRWTRGPSPRP